MADQYGYAAMPGPSAPSITNERNALLGPITWYLLKGIVIKGSAAVDAGNTPTTELRHGLLMGKRDSDGFYAHYNPAATDGTQIVEGFLWEPRRTLDSDGNTVDRPAQLVIAAYVKASQLLLLDENARGQMEGRFIFDDRLGGVANPWGSPVAKTADYTVVAGTDSGKHFTNSGAAGAVNFTLPAPARGNHFRFSVTANQNVTITAPAGTLVTFNNAAATSIAFSTAGNKIGASVEIVADDAGTKWIAIPNGANTMTVA